MNATNGTAQEAIQYFDPPKEETKVFITIAYGVVLLVALTANMFVIYITLGNKSASSPPFNLFIINLAVCDTLYAMVVVPLQLGYLYMGFTWFQGSFALILCKVKEFALIVVISASVYTLVAMAVDRYLAAARALRRPMSKKHVLLSIAFVWSVSCILSAPELYKFKTFSIPGQEFEVTLCIASWTMSFPSQNQDVVTANRIEFILKLVLFYIIPLASMAVLYGFIIRILRKRPIPGIKTAANRRKKYRKIIQTLVAMVIVFAVGWLPVHVIHLMVHFARSTTLRLPYVVYLFMFWTAHANCAVNPCLFFVFNKDYREKLLRVVQRYLACCSRLRKCQCQLVEVRKRSYSCQKQVVTERTYSASREVRSATQETRL